LIYNEEPEITLMKLKGLNGVLLPGGTGNYVKVAKLVIKEAKK